MAVATGDTPTTPVIEDGATFCLSAKALKDAVKHVGRVVPKYGADAVRAVVFGVGSAGRLTLTATDLERWEQVGLSGESSFPTVRVGVEHKPLKTAVAALSGRKRAMVHVTVTAEHVELEQDGATTILRRSCDARDIPEMPGASTWGEPVDACSLLRAVPRVAGAASTDEARPILTGVSIGTAPDGTRDITANDSYRLATKTIALDDVFPDVLLPAKALADVAAWHDPAATRMAPSTSGHSVAFVSPRGVSIVRVIGGDYPRWRGLVPDESRVSAARFTAHAADWAKPVLALHKQAPKPLFPSSQHPIVFEVPPAGAVRASLRDGGETVSSRPLPVDNLTGVGVEVGFNGGFMSQLMSMGDDGNGLRVLVVDNLKPAVFRSDDGWTAILMPLRTDLAAR